MTERRKSKILPPVSATSANAAAGKTHVLFEVGTILETVLINRLDGGFAGPVECLLSTDVYSNDRQHLLIPAGLLPRRAIGRKELKLARRRLGTGKSKRSNDREYPGHKTFLI